MNGYWITGLAGSLLGIAIGAGGAYVYENRAVLAEQVSHAHDNEQHADDLLNVSKAALDAESRAIDAGNKAASAVAAADAATTQKKEDHETDNRSYRTALGTGAERVRVAVSNCSAAGTDDVPGPASAARMGDGGSAVADLDPAVAERVFGVAGDDQREIDKVTALQAYICAIRPTTPGCK